MRVTEVGRQARYHGRKMQIAWRDAHYFSVSGIVGPEQLRTYTLSGEQEPADYEQLRPANSSAQIEQECEHGHLARTTIACQSDSHVLS